QVDLPSAMKSGLREVPTILEGVDDIAICRLTNKDVVRHPLVGQIAAAYDRYEARRPR
ncbi:MAG: PhoH family protein, partial [Propionibacteriaceae bacterium]|nr:PhoH family protein [Propionibacteriaceae bacterium]